MGVPKFFRYISERYPCLSELVKEYQIPEFDNLYLDMNGIIHTCSHPDDNNPHFRITEEKIFKDIFHYIEVLFRMIRPQKLFFMAVDGVAPRAKMNQQRGRRFRSAKDAEKQEADAIKKGELLPTEARFDSNCITPGTVFMAKLHEQLKYFVVNKISSDPAWQKCKVILSGHETPGEGEHKIMDYIRYMRAQPGHDPNTRHCLYGLDADLIMLGLCTHEPHFSLLREEVKFGRKSTKRASVPEEITFYLLHLSLMREYLELEFAPLRDKLQGFYYDIEKIIDDWVLMGFLVGNDFIPNLPNLHIANGALPVLYKAYIEILPTLDGYINEGGTLNLSRFGKFMEKLGSIDLENFEEIRDDLLYMEAKTGRKWNAHTKVSTKNLEEWVPDEEKTQSVNLEPLEPEKHRDSGMLALINQTNSMFLDSEDEEAEQSDEDDAFESYKRDYYMNKLEYSNVTPEVLRDQAEGYVRAIQWNLNYYYNGCCSWSWYYPHHYAPYISDIKGFSNLKIEFDMGKPFLPYEQLLAVLPSASKNLLPECYHHLMTDPDSPIKNYYPEEFQTDLNGKKQEWEAVVLVPFIDEKVLLETMKTFNDQLTPEEKQRNSHGPMLVYTYTKDNKGRYPAPEYFPPVTESHVEVSTLLYNDVLIPKEKLVKGAYPGVKTDIYYPGFPTMKHLQYKAELKKAKIKVFESPSRNENMIINITNTKFPDDKIPVDILGTSIWVGWPHLVEAKVVAISNKKRKYVSVGDSNGYNVEERTEHLIKQFDKEVEGITEYYSRRMGIEVGETKVLVHVQVMTGRKYVFSQNGRITLDKIFTPNIANYPLQAVVFDIATYDSFHSAFRDVKDVFPVGCTCFTLSNPYYGSQGEVLDNKEVTKNGRVKINIKMFKEPDLTPVREMHSNSEKNYKTLYHAASQLSISNFLFSRITGSIFITARNGEGGLKNVNIGLDLKFNKKNKETPGYTKKIDNTWTYTNKAVELVRQYSEKYPEVFDYLSQGDKCDEIQVESIFKDDWEEKLKELQSWLRSLPTHSIERQVCGGLALDAEEVAAIEKIVDEGQKTITGKKCTMQIKPNFLYRCEIQNGSLPPDPKCKTMILDRIINVRTGYTVPLGLKGTVISIQVSADGSGRDTMFDVVFDKPFTDGMKLNCSEERGYRLPKSAFINISHGQRMMIEKTGKPNEVIAASQQSNLHPTTVTLNKQWYGIFPPQTQPPFQKENSAFAQFSSAPIQDKAEPNPQYDTFQGYHGNTNTRPTAQQRYSQKQQSYANGANGNGTGRKGPQRNDFMPNFVRAGQNPKEAKSQLEHSPRKLSGTTIVNNTQNAQQSVNVDILKTILKIGKERESKEREERKSLTKDDRSSDSYSQHTSSNTQDVAKEDSTGIKLDMFAEAAKAPATIRLLTYYQSNHLGLPRYQYFNNGKLIQSQITLPTGEVVVGKAAVTREEASENVAAVVLDLFMKKAKTEAQLDLTSHPSTNSISHKTDQQSDNAYSKPPKSVVLNNSLVPLQAIRNHINKTSKPPSTEAAQEVSTKENIPESGKSEEASKVADKHNSKVQHDHSQNRNRRQRKTRIAANFDALKSGTAKP